jgi:TrmH RNA methyltransferase
MRNKLTDELAVCGVNAVLALGEYHPETINRLFLREERLQTFSGICKQLAERKRPYKICEDGELERVCKSVHHQGVAAMIEEPVVSPLSQEDLDLWAAEGKLDWCSIQWETITTWGPLPGPPLFLTFILWC